MSTKRDNLFPATSIGRAQGASIARTSSREALAVHPLLNPGSSAPPSNPTLDGASNAKYVPYTPRQRPASTGGAVQAATPLTSQGGAPASVSTGANANVSKPLASLRTAAQNAGLDATSVGSAILEKIAHEGDVSDEWTEIWSTLTKARAMLLLPTAPASGHELITPEFVQDHLVLCNPASRHDTPVVTLSGLRGYLANDVLTLRSTVHRATKPFQALLAPVSRAASLGALPPLPPLPAESSYPSFAVSGFCPALPLPARPTKPPLPPRPGARGVGTPPSARLSMPFASLFGRPSTPPPQPSTPTAPAFPPTEADTVDVPALIIDAPLSRTDIATGIVSALKGELAMVLSDQPPWLVERVHAFAAGWFPFVRATGKKRLQDIGVGQPGRVMWAVNAATERPEEMAERFQAFYRAVEGELRSGRVHGDAEQVEEEEGVDEARICDVLETIESALCTLLYDRLFLPPTSDDASHNEALSSRIAALNMLDLGLEHLDIDIGDANATEVDAVVHACGQTLAQLDLAARSPREKAAVLVSAHKLVVVGLTKIPPIRLKSQEDDSKDPASTEHAASVASIHVSSPEPAENQGPSTPTSPDPPTETASSTSTSSPVSGDVLLPILIFSVVKSNPSRLVSHLLFTQRFRNQSVGGEENYCLINLMAVAEFLENVDLGALGLGESEKKVLSTANLTPIPIAPVLPGDEHPASLRGRMGQGVDAFAGSANKVISGVVDTSFGVLRALLPQTTGAGQAVVPSSSLGTSAATTTGPAAGTSTGTGETDGLWGARPSLGLLRRETGFSIAGLTAALPGAPGRAKSHGQSHSQSHAEEEGQRELVEVSSRPTSLKSHRSEYEEGEDDQGEGLEESAGEGESEGEGEDAEEGKDEEEGEGDEEEEGEEEAHDARSIKSFESMLSSGRTRRRTTGTGARSTNASSSVPTRRRKRLSDLTDRLTHGMAGMSRRVQGGDAQRAAALSGRIPAPNRRFVECTEQDIRVSEVSELLREYQRLVEAVRVAGGFQE